MAKVTHEVDKAIYADCPLKNCESRSKFEHVISRWPKWCKWFDFFNQECGLPNSVEFLND